MTRLSAGGPGRAAGLGRLLTSPDYRRLWLVGLFANATRWLEMLAAGIFTFDLTGSAFLVATMTLARMLPMLLLGAVAGAVADAINRRTLLLGGLAAMATSAGVLLLLAASGSLALWHIFAGGLVTGTVWATEMSVRRRMVSEAAGRERVAQAIALDSVTNNLTRMVGPILGGFLYETVGLTGVYLLTTTLHAASLVLIVGLRYAQERRPLALARIPAEIAEGLQIARARPTVLGALAVTVLVNCFAFSFMAVIPPIGREVFMVSPTLIGALAAAEAMGALGGSFVIALGFWPSSHARLFVLGSALLFVSLIAAALAPTYLFCFLAMLVAGIGAAGFGNMQSTLILTETPAEARSRVMGLVTVCIGTAPIGVMTVGALADWIGPSEGMLVMAACGLACLALLVRRIPAMLR